MTKEREALKLALEALEQLQGGCTDSDDGTVEAITVWCPEVIDAIKEALAQPEQEPVAEVVMGRHPWDYGLSVVYLEKCLTVGTKLYTTPPQRKPWVSLTDDEGHRIVNGCKTGSSREIFRAIEAKLKEKNT